MRLFQFVFVTSFVLFFAILIISLPQASAGSYEVVDMAGVEIKTGEYHVFELGELEPNTEIYFYITTEHAFDYSKDEEFDCLFMNQSQYDVWLDGDSFSFNFDASALAADGYEPYLYIDINYYEHL